MTAITMGMSLWMLSMATLIAPICALLWRAVRRHELRGWSRPGSSGLGAMSKQPNVALSGPSRT